MSHQTESADKAVALLYDELSAPKLTAKGDDELAAQIISLAKEHNIPVKKEPELVKALSEIDLGEEIPEQLYVAVAEVLSFAFILKNKVPAHWHQDKDTSLVAPP